MNVSSHTAAQKLVAQIDAPEGLVTTVIERTMKGRQRIRVLVDRSYRNRLTGVPKIFMGFNVVVDFREPFAARA